MRLGTADDGVLSLRTVTIRTSFCGLRAVLIMMGRRVLVKMTGLI